MQKKLMIESEKYTFIDSLFPDMNFYIERLLYCGRFNNDVTYRSLLYFDVSNLAHDYVENCFLKLFIVRNDNMEDEISFAIHPLTQEWDAEQVTWNIQPTLNEEQKVTSVIDCNYWEEVTWDITDIVKGWLANPKNNHGLLLKAEHEKSNNNSLVAFLSNKNGFKEWRPRIEVSYKHINQQIISKQNPTIAILTPQFFEWDGGRCLFGGGERYLIDFVKLAQQLGYKVEVFQPSNGNYWERVFEGITIKGIGIAGLEQDFMTSINNSFNRYTEKYDYHVYFSMDVAYPEILPNSICISHGIWWDTVEREWWRTDEWYEKIFKILNSIDLLVSVDTNTINWINAVKPESKCKKIYIPNYVDLEIFKVMRTRKKVVRAPSPLRRRKRQLSNNLINILYPRRLHPGRGWSICKAIALELVNEYKNIKFTFVGRGSEEAERHMNLFAAKHPRLEYKWYEMEDMYKAYLDADIVLIPSLYSEGTSLSLLEAMACGKPVIAGMVGGLTDIIINGYNGYLINIDKENLKGAIIKLVENPRLRKNIAFNAMSTVESFSKHIWQNRWRAILYENFPIT